jgi:hypothetical protein
MNIKNVLVGGVLGTIFVFIFDMVVHGMLLVGQYEMYESLWRPESAMQSMMWFMVLSQAMLAFAMAYFVNRNHRHGWESGARFGAMVGVFLAIMAVTQYMYMPVDFTLPLLWAVAIFVTATSVGAIAGSANK